MHSGSDSRTLTATEDPEAPGYTARDPYVFLVLQANCPLAPPARIALSRVSEIVFGRGSARSIEAEEGEEGRRIVVRVDDRRMSSTHARLIKVLRRWVIEDAGSKNHTFVNGVEQTSAKLADGDIIELGHTFFLFREAIPSDPEAPAIQEGATNSAGASGLETLLPALVRAYDEFAAIARSPVSVILEGETGTGKEVLARALHELSGRSGPFVAINCGALARELIEGELFGHRKGAFSGATEDRPGLVRSADKGTLFLDEIGDLPISAQTVLLRVLQEREVRPLGGTRPIAVDLRVVSATHHALDQMVTAGDFRADLLTRIAGHRFALPPLRGRIEDLGLLLGALLKRVCREQGETTTLHPRAVRALLRHGWPGNVRELEQCLSSAVVLARNAGRGQIDLEHLPIAVQRALRESPGARGSTEATRREELAALMREHGGNITAVAQQMGKGRTQVQRWLKRYGIDPAQFRR